MVTVLGIDVSGYQDPERVNYAELKAHGFGFVVVKLDQYLTEEHVTLALTEGFIRESGTGRAAFLIEFLLQDNHFKLIWHVLKSRAGDEKAAKVQAATAMYHDVKAKCLRSIWAGARAAFLEWLLLPNGQTAAEAVSPDLLAAIPALISPRMGLLPGSDVVDGEYRVTAG